MERLTKSWGKKCVSSKIDYAELSLINNETFNEFEKVIYKLGEFEDLEEQNKLVKLKFKPGDKVYLIDENVEEYIVVSIVIEQSLKQIYNICNFEKRWIIAEDRLYATREEAEKAQEEMENGQND